MLFLEDTELIKSNLNNEKLCCKAEASDCIHEESNSLSEEDKKRKKANVLDSGSIKKNCDIKQKQVLAHQRSQFY